MNDKLKTYKINEISQKRILGRYSPSVLEKGSLPLFWAASGLEICVKAKEIRVLVESDFYNCEIWLAVSINGALVSRQMVQRGQSWICISTVLNPEKENVISIQRETQPMGEDSNQKLILKEIALNEEGQFCKLPERAMKLEFVGDSITSGEGLYGACDEWDWITPWMSGTKTYAAMTARKLNAEYSLVSQCGWGLCWGWDGNRKSVIPPHYEEVCSIMYGENQEKLGCAEKHNFLWQPDVIVVNLGTNDNGAFFQPAWKDENGKEYVLKVDENQKACAEDGKQISDGAVNFLKLLRKHNPMAKIIWVWGMIKLVAVPDYIQKGIEEYKKETGDKNVFSLELESMEELEKCAEDKGSRGHPGPLTHKKACEKITEFIKNLKA